MGILAVLLPPMVVALFVWWFTTGMIIALYGVPRQVQRWAFFLYVLAILAILAGLVAIQDNTSEQAVYLSFVGGTLIWGLLLSGYYLGFITGPGRTSTLASSTLDEQAQGAQGPSNIGLARRFWLALRSSLYHELLVLATILLLARLLSEGPNRWALWTVLTLWLMHSSGKLNVFFGVRNFRIEFLPAHLHFLDKLLEKKPINPFFPLSVFLASAVALALGIRAFAPGVAVAQATGLLLLSSMIGLGVLEHWLLVLPIPKTIWGWGLRVIPRRGLDETAPKAVTSPIAEPIAD